MKESPGRGRVTPPQSIGTSAAKSEDEDKSQLLMKKLLFYECASRTQDADFQANCAHLWPLFVTLQHIGNVDREYDEGEQNTGRKVAKNRNRSKGSFFGFGSSRGGTSASSADEVKTGGHLSYENIAHAYKSITSDQERTKPDRASITDHNMKLIKADRQLIYILEQLSKSKSNTKQPDRTNTMGVITFPEFVQCYRLVVGGFQTMEHISSGNVPDPHGEGTSGSSFSDEDLFQAKKRTANRVAAIVKTFGPMEFGSFGATNNTLSRTPTRPSSKKSSPSPSITIGSGGSGIFPAKLFGSSIADTSDDEMETAVELEEEVDYLRRLLAVKDKQLVRTLNDHADNVESLGHEASKRDDSIRRYIRKKRRRRKWRRQVATMLLVLIVLVCYEIGIITVVVVNGIPYVSLHFDLFSNISGTMSDREFRSMKQSSLEKTYQIQTLERQNAALKAELKTAIEQSEEYKQRRQQQQQQQQQQQSYSEYFQYIVNNYLGPFMPETETKPS